MNFVKKSFVPFVSVAIATTVGLLPLLTSAQTPEPPKSKINFEKEIVPIVKASCLGCHNKDNAKHNVMFQDKMTLEEAMKNPRLWTKSAREVKNKVMPPRDHSTMSDKDRTKFVSWVEATFPRPKPPTPPTPPTTGGGGL